MKAKEKNWLYENRYNIVFLVTLTVGLVIWLAVGINSYKASKRVSEERKIVFDNFCEYITDKDIEYIEPINKDTSLYTDKIGAIVKLYGEEPRTFEGLRWDTEISTDNKYHVAIRYKNTATVYVPNNNTVDFISK